MLDVSGAVIVVGLAFAAANAVSAVQSQNGYVSSSNYDVITDAVAFSIVQGVAGLAAAFGLWLLQEWGRWLSIARTVLLIVMPLLLSASQPVTGVVLLQVLISVAVIIYLLQPGVRQAFVGEE